jgi:hypothetical protein
MADPDSIRFTFSHIVTKFEKTAKVQKNASIASSSFGSIRDKTTPIEPKKAGKKI